MFVAWDEGMVSRCKNGTCPRVHRHPVPVDLTLGNRESPAEISDHPFVDMGRYRSREIGCKVNDMLTIPLMRD